MLKRRRNIMSSKKENYISPWGLLDYSIQRRYNSWLNYIEWVKNTQKRYNCLLDSSITNCIKFLWQLTLNVKIAFSKRKDILLQCVFIPAVCKIHDNGWLWGQKTMCWFTKIKAGVGAKSPWPAGRLGHWQLQREWLHCCDGWCQSPQETARRKEPVLWFVESLHSI